MKDGFRAWSWNLIVFVRQNDLGVPRLGLAVGRKVGNAVARNRWKRLIRELFRNRFKPELIGRDMVVAVKAVPGFGRNRGPEAEGRQDEPPAARTIPAISDLEGELVDALRRINRKMAGPDGGDSSRSPD